jgi:hypothetical protein
MIYKIREFGAEFEPLFDIDGLRELFRCPSMCFKGGGGGGKYADIPMLTGSPKWAQSQLYSTVQRGIAGGGLLPFNRIGPIKGAYERAHRQTKPFLQTYLNRMVPKADTTVRDYADRMFDRSYYGGMQDLREQEKLAPYEEGQEALNMGMQLLAGEKQISANITDIYNRGQMAESQMPTFGSQLGYGLGSGAGILAAQRYAQMMNSQGGG